MIESGEGDRLRERHFGFFHAQFRERTADSQRPRSAAYLEQLRVEEQNLRAALAHGLSSTALAQEGVELASALFFYWTKRGLFRRGTLLARTGCSGRARPDRPERARLIGLGHMADWQGRLTEMAAHNQQALILGRAHGDEVAVAFALFGQALSAFETGDFVRAADHAEAARAADAAIGNSVLHRAPLIVLGNLALVAGDQGGARFEHFDDADRRTTPGWVMRGVWPSCCRSPPDCE